MYVRRVTSEKWKISAGLRTMRLSNIRQRFYVGHESGSENRGEDWKPRTEYSKQSWINTIRRRRRGVPSADWVCLNFPCLAGVKNNFSCTILLSILMLMWPALVSYAPASAEAIYAKDWKVWLFGFAMCVANFMVRVWSNQAHDAAGTCILTQRLSFFYSTHHYTHTSYKIVN